MQSTTHAAGSSATGPPRLVRRLAFGALGLLVAGALYLIAVRGEAIVVDLATLAGRMWCF